MREKQERMKRTSTDTATNASHDLDHDAVNDEVSASSSPNAIDSGKTQTSASEISKNNKCVGGNCRGFELTEKICQDFNWMIWTLHI